MSYYKFLISLQIGFVVLTLLMDVAVSTEDVDYYASLVNQLRDGIESGRKYLEDHREDIRDFLNSLNVEEGMDVEKWVKKAHDTSDQQGPSFSSQKSKKKMDNNMDALYFMARVLELKEQWDKGQMDYGSISRLLLEAVEFLASDPSYGQMIVSYLLNANPTLRQRADELVNKLLPLLLDALTQGSLEAIFDKKVVLPTLDILSELLLSDNARLKVTPMVEPSIDLIHNSIRVFLRWHENATTELQRSQLPDVTDVFGAVVLPDVRRLSRSTKKMNRLERTLRELPAPKNPADKRRVDSLTLALTDAANQARHLEAALEDSVGDPIEASLRALPRLRRFVQETSPGGVAIKHVENHDADAHRQLRELGATVEQSMNKLAAVEKLVHDARNVNSIFDTVIVARDLLEVIDGVPRLEPIATPFRKILERLNGIREIIVDG